MNFSVRPYRQLNFANLLDDSTSIGNIEFQKLNSLEKKGMILITAKEIYYSNFDWKENTINLLLNKKRMALVKVFRNLTVDPTRVLTTAKNDLIFYFKRGTSKIEIVYTTENFSFKNLNLPFLIADVTLCPCQQDSFLLISAKSLFSYNYITETSKLLNTVDSDLVSVAVSKDLKITALCSSYKIYLTCSERNIPLATILISKPLVEAPCLNQVFGNTVLSLFCKDFLNQTNDVCFRCYDIKRLDTDLITTDLKRLESDLYLDPSRAFVLSKIGYMMLWNNTSKGETKTWLEFRNLRKYGEKELPSYSISRDDDSDGTQNNIWSSFEDDKFLLEVQRDGAINVFQLAMK